MEHRTSQTDLPRAEVIAKLKGFIEVAKNTPLSELCKRGDYDERPELKYPQTKGEYLANEILDLLLFQSWIDIESEPVLEEIFSVAGQLDQDIDRPDLWRELFDWSSQL